MAGARPIVDLPVFTSLPFGLWESAQKPEAPSHWQQGVTWIERCPTGSTTYDECISVTGTGSPPASPSKIENVEQEFRGATPITVFTRFDCSPVGIGDAERAASDALARVENRLLEAAFWTGVSGGQTVVFPHLASDSELTDSDGITLQTAASICVTGADIAHGLGELEDCLSDCYAGQGVIHIPVNALPTFAAWNLAIERDGGLWTPRGNRIVVGTGYANTGPDGTVAPAGFAWIYATGAVFAYRGNAFFTREVESFDRAENTMQMIAERTYVIGWECCHIAALVNIGVSI